MSTDNQNLDTKAATAIAEQPPTEPRDPDAPDNAEVATPKSPKRFVVPALIVLAVLGGVGWIVFNRIIYPILMFSQMKPQLTQVELSSPTTAPIADSSDYAASLDSRQAVNLQPRVSGQVAAIYVAAGDAVTAGQPLIQIDAREQRAQVASQEAAVQTAIAEVETARATADNARDTLKSLEARRATAQANVQLNQREYERYLNLYNQGAESRQILDQKLNALQTAQASLRQAEADIQAQRASINRELANVERNRRAVDQARANVDSQEAQLQYYTITAPFTGIVGNIPTKVGDFVSNTTQLLSLTQNNQLEIQIAIPLERSPDLRTGLPVQLLDTQDKVLQTGRISFISPTVDPTTQSVLVKAAFANAGQLRTAQFVRARVIWARQTGVLVPTTAISRLGGKNFLFVAKPFKDSGCEAPAKGGFGAPTTVEPDQLTAVQTEVELGKIVGNNQEVTKAITPRDRIVTSGILQLQNCMPIAEATQAAPSPAP